MYELKKKIGKAFTSKYVGTGSSSYEKRIYQAAVPQMLVNTAIRDKIEKYSRSRQAIDDNSCTMLRRKMRYLHVVFLRQKKKYRHTHSYYLVLIVPP